jgi:CRISPR-associated protein Cmr6
MRPVYKELTDSNLSSTAGDRNTGLWYDKFCDQWSPQWELETRKQDWIKTVTGAKGTARLISESSGRAAYLIDAVGGQLAILKTEGPFVTGLGREHPVENGFAWHHTLGTAYLAASSVKGTVRAWAAKREGASESEINRIFGPRSATESNIGTVLFLDALPVAPVTLKADVMTPHYAPYYDDDTGKTPPADWHSPVPIPFLVVDAGQAFLFGLLPRDSKEPQHQSDCKVAIAWLAEALEWIGAGAKTAVGYGRFVRDIKNEEEINTRVSQGCATCLWAGLVSGSN